MTFLKDLNGFSNRKMFCYNCPNCGVFRVVISETRISDNKVFLNTLKSNEAVQFVAKEYSSKRVIQTIDNYKTDKFNGWVYGKNVQIKNKKGKVVRIKQYSADMKSNKTTLTKVIKAN